MVQCLGRTLTVTFGFSRRLTLERARRPMAETAAVQNRVTRIALRHRKSADGLSAEQSNYLRNGIAAMKGLNDDRSFAYHAGIHGLPLPMFCQHGTPLFLPWHRAYLYFFELALRDRVPQAMLPWWDWTSSVSHRSGLPALYARARVDGKANPLYASQIPPVARQPGGPTRTTVASISGLPARWEASAGPPMTPSSGPTTA
jgi:tyrosinase